MNENLAGLVRKMRRYFNEEATEEILETILPRFCPHDNAINSAQALLCVFLPTNNKNTDWFEKIFNLWGWTEASFVWDFHFFELFSRFAKDHPEFDWTNYEKIIFTRILFTMELPIGKETPKYYNFSNDSLSIFAKEIQKIYKLPFFTSKLIIYILHKKSNTMNLLKKLLNSIEFYYHPSNSGNYSSGLIVWLSGLSKNFAKRFKIEKKSYLNEISKEFVEMVLPIADVSLFSKMIPLGFQASQCFKHLSYLHPEIVFPKVYERMMYALQTLTETHQTYVVYELFVVTHYSILQNVTDKNFVSEIFHAALPGIDTNDNLKTNLALDFYYQLLCTIPVIATGKKGVEFMDESDDISLSFLHEWSLSLLQKLFNLIENQNPKEKKDKMNFMNTSPRLENLSIVLFSQMSSEIFDEASKMLIKFVTSNYYPNGVKLLGNLLNGAACASSEFTLKLFKVIYDKLIQKEKLDHLNSEEISYYLILLGNTFSGINSSQSILKLKKEIFQLSFLVIEKKEKIIFKGLRKFLKGINYSLTQIYPADNRSASPEVWNSKDFQTSHYKEWGKSIPAQDSNLSWHFPSKEEISMVTELYNNLGDSYSSKLTTDFDSILRIYTIIKSFNKSIPVITEDLDNQYTRTLNFFDPFSYITETKYTRYFWAELLHRNIDLVTSKLEPKYACQYVKTIQTLLFKKVKNNKESVKKSSLKHMDYRFFDSNCEEKVYPRIKYSVLAKNQLNFRRNEVKIPFSKIYNEILQDLKKLSLIEYSTIRKKAQETFKKILSQFKSPLSKKYVPEIIDILKKKDVQKNELNGAIYLLMDLEKSVKNSWELYHQMIIALLTCNQLEEVNIQQRIQKLFQKFIMGYNELKPNPKSYQSLIKDLIQLDSESIHWKNRLMLHTILSLFVRADLNPMFPIEATKSIIKTLTSDIVPLRSEISPKTLYYIFTQYKPIHPKKTIQFDTSKIEDFNTLSQPKNQQEWEETQFFEKNYFGYFKKPKEIQVVDYKGDYKDSHQNERNEFIKEIDPLFTDEFLSQALTFMAISPHKFEKSSGSGYQFGYAQMFKGLFQIFKFEFFEKIKSPLEKLLAHSGSGKPEEELNIEVAVQIIGGLVRGMKHWKFEDREKVIHYLKGIFKKLFDTSSLICTRHIELCINFCVYDLDVRKTRWLIDFLLDNVDLENGTSNEQAKGLTFLYNALCEISWRDESFFLRLNKILYNHFDHPYQQVREIICRLQTLYFRFYTKPIYTLEKAPEKQENMFKIIQKMKQVYQDSKDKHPIMKTFLQWYDHTFRVSFLVGSIYLEEALPLLLEIYDKTSSDNDLQMASKICLILTSSNFYHIEIAKKVVNSLSNLNQFDSWRVRFAIISFFQLFAFRHQFYDISVMESILSSLSDKSLEVRTLASSTLAGFMKISSSQTIQQFMKKFMKNIKKPTNDQEVLECHYNVLGLSSIVQAFPYEVPDFLPKVLVHLSKYSDFKSPIGPTVKKTFSEFWKSHQDSWHLHKEKFTEDELSIISQLKSSSQYFA